MPKPIVLHIGEPIKYNQEFYEEEYLSRFDVVRNKDLDRESFVSDTGLYMILSVFRDFTRAHIAIPVMFAVLGNVISIFIATLGERYSSIFPLCAGSYSPYNLYVYWLSASLPRPASKGAASLAIINLMRAGITHFYTSYAFPDTQRPWYYGGGSMMCSSSLVCALTTIAIKFHLKRENVRFKREDMGGEVPVGTIKASKSGSEAVVSFRYVH